MKMVKMMDEISFRDLVKNVENQHSSEGLQELVLMICERMEVEENLDIINIIKKINKSKIIDRIDKVMDRTKNDSE